MPLMKPEDKGDGSIMELGLEDRVALVTGSSQGIGKAIASELSKEGAKSQSAQEMKMPSTKLLAKSVTKPGTRFFPLGQICQETVMLID